MLLSPHEAIGRLDSWLNGRRGDCTVAGADRARRRRNVRRHDPHRRARRSRPNLRGSCLWIRAEVEKIKQCSCRAADLARRADHIGKLVRIGRSPNSDISCCFGGRDQMDQA